MRLERLPDDRRGLALGPVLGAALLVSAALAVVWLSVGLPGPVCYLREWSGIPCPTCGSTRLARSLLAGRVLEAFAWNPLVFSALGGVAVWATASTARRLAGLPAWRLVLGRRERLVLRVLAAAALAAGWAYLVWRGA